MPRTRLFPIKRESEPGAAPGTMIAPSESRHPVLDIVAYGPDAVVEHNDISITDIEKIRSNYPILWVNIVGLGNADLIAQIGRLFDLHKLALEDVLNTHQRPKAEEFKDHIFLVTRMLRSESVAGSEQVSIFLGKDYVLSFQEDAGDCLERVRQRIRQSSSRIREQGADYLCYALLDSVVDDYFPVLEQYGEDLEVLEDAVISRTEPGQIKQLHDLKRELLSIRRAIWPHREMINTIIRDENALVSKNTRVYLRDVYDHTNQLIDIVKTYREIASGLVDVYISSASAKLNEIMKVLTIIATVFMPLGFIASLYGMNFDRSTSAWNMPELGWRFGYAFSLLLMGGVAVGLLVYFGRKGWLRPDKNTKSGD